MCNEICNAMCNALQCVIMQCIMQCVWVMCNHTLASHLTCPNNLQRKPLDILWYEGCTILLDSAPPLFVHTLFNRKPNSSFVWLAGRFTFWAHGAGGALVTPLLLNCQQLRAIYCPGHPYDAQLRAMPLKANDSPSAAPWHQCHLATYRLW